jgi:hypothetical protein
MIKRFIILLPVLACFAVNTMWAASNTLTLSEKKSGWKLLFDGKTLDGWTATGNPDGWTVENGTITDVTKNGGYLATKEQFKNFALSMEFKIVPGANSGIFFRWTDLNDPVQTAIEMQILDSYEVKEPYKHDCGAIYDCLAPTKNACKPAGEWNKAVINCRNNLIWIDMNGKRIIYMNLNRWTTPHMNPDGTGNKFKTAYEDMTQKGYIGFQDYGQRLWFRNIKIRPL